MKSKSFLITWTLLTSLSLAAVALFNWKVDPFCAYAPRDNFSITPAKRQAGERAGNRVISAEKARHLDADILLLGSSRCHMGVDPDHPAWGDGVIVNLGLMGASIFEMHELFQFAIAQHKPKRAVFFADFFMFAKDSCGRADFAQSLLNKHRDQLSYHGDLLLSKYITQTSYRVYKMQQAISSSQTATGEIKEKGGAQGSRELMLHKLEQVIKDFYRDVYDPDSMKYMQQIIQTCHEQNIELTIVMLPVHALQLEGIHYKGLWQTFEHWKKQMLAATDDAIPLWDFTGYQHYHTEPVPAAGSDQRMTWYSDMSHCTHLLGGWAISRINDINKVDENSLHDFGIKLNTENIDRHLEKIRSDRASFVVNNQHMLQLFNEAEEAVKKYYRKHPRRGVLAARQDKVFPCTKSKG